tara:strand:- start:5587 stop:6882 length:1296 start_codon:yes stop_codon:yes gene_type:complete
MATVNFLYRSTKDNSPISVRLLFRHNNKDFVIGAKTKFLPYCYEDLEKYPSLTAKHYWQKIHKLKRIKDVAIGSITLDQNFIKNKQKEVNDELTKIDTRIITRFHIANPDSINKDWLQKVLDSYYSPNKEAPKDLIGYFDYYIQKKNKLKTGTIRKITTVKNRIEKFLGNIPISEIDDKFKDKIYQALSDYAPNTIEGTIKEIKTICTHAHENQIKVNPKVLKWVLSYDNTEIIYLKPNEIEDIQKLNNLPDNLENARDWLIISCFTGQRISDFLRFEKSMIRKEKNKNGKLVFMLEFTQIKTDRIMSIPLHKNVLNILNKRNGEFPKTISDVKYNLYIKRVARNAKLLEPTKGSLRIKLADKKFRHEKGIYPKWKLVSSHIGRRSYCTNNFGKIPTHLLMYASGHSRELTFLAYVGKTNTDKGHELANFY